MFSEPPVGNQSSITALSAVKAAGLASLGLNSLYNTQVYDISRFWDIDSNNRGLNRYIIQYVLCAFRFILKKLKNLSKKNNTIV
ncbi:hypothetical protein LX24_02138 [Desulfallas thermosapovorans DSM 6562]|uniref:Uncharacterized protein n=1 Tax=Desulfallas thermosapovorans DSM 6562 TaxID=1121431 RepID=A0A5S4ZQC4_9FIRM|nr:hypothetical protein LX24_02138 [Desulfallas thermosapovorans DSM 6562]